MGERRIMSDLKTVLMIASLSLASFSPVMAQDATEEAAAQETVASVTEDGLLTEAALDKLMAPVALYPDTLLIQVLVAATYPLDVVKGERFLAESELEGDDLKAAITEEGWDDSVAVLATAFPEVLTKMGDHVDWTETVGDAMLAQTDDVQASIQRLRDQAIQTGALISTDEQLVETVDDEVVIAPADPEVVYVPEYEPEVVYAQDSGSDLGDALLTGGLIFGSAILINEIFDDDDDWDDYWGCRNCGGWGGGPIVRDPDIDIDVDGNVNIGNDINIGDGSIGWKPDEDRKEKAKDNIGKKRDDIAKIENPVARVPDRGDDLRAQLSKEAGVKDIAKDKGVSAKDIRKEVGNAPTGARAKDIKSSAGNKDLKRPAMPAQKPAIKKPAVKKPTANKPAAVRKPAAQKPKTFKPSAQSRPANKKAQARGTKSKAKSRGTR